MVEFSGSWKNGNGSRLEVRDLSGGVINGRFESGVGDEGHVLWVDVHGSILGNVVTFHAVYPEYGTIVSWVGQHVVNNGVDELRTQWLHASDVPDNLQPQWAWSSNRIGSDTFVRC